MQELHINRNETFRQLLGLRILLMLCAGTTDSTASEEDGVPPPLPLKTKEPDYCNLPDDVDSPVTVVPPSTPRVINKVSDMC